MLLHEQGIAGPAGSLSFLSGSDGIHVGQVRRSLACDWMQSLARGNHRQTFNGDLSNIRYLCSTMRPGTDQRSAPWACQFLGGGLLVGEGDLLRFHDSSFFGTSITWRNRLDLGTALMAVIPARSGTLQEDLSEKGIDLAQEMPRGTVPHKRQQRKEVNVIKRKQSTRADAGQSREVSVEEILKALSLSPTEPSTSVTSPLDVSADNEADAENSDRSSELGADNSGRQILLSESLQKELPIPIDMRSAHKPGSPQPAKVGAQTEASPTRKKNVGDPLGRKVIGRDAAAWISQGIGAFVGQMVSKELQEGCGAELTSSVELVQLAQDHLARSQMPAGAEDKCQLAMKHYPTVWDHLQREAQAALQTAQANGQLADWRQSATWLLIKRLARSGEHRATVRNGAQGPQGSARQLNAHQLAEAQASIDAYVARALELLRIERDADLDAAQDVVTSPAGNVQDSEDVRGSQGEQQLAAVTEERSNALRGLTAVSSTTGLGGAHLVTIRAGKGQRLPPTTLSPGDMVCVRVESRGGGAGECMKGHVYSLGDDVSTLTVAIEARYGDPLFSRLFGRPLRLDVISALADTTTYDRNREALERLRKDGLNVKSPAFPVVAALFSQTPLNLVPPSPPPVALPSSPATQEVHHTATSPSLAAGGNDLETRGQVVAVDGAEDSLPLASASSEAGTGGRPMLDESQEAAIDLALDQRVPLGIIQGPPGTGKTTVVAELIRRATAGGWRVLAAAPTNAAVDNLVEKLSAAGVRVVRVGNPARVATNVARHSLDYQVEVRMASFRRDAARRRADFRTDLRECKSEPDMEAGIRGMLRQLARALRQKEKDVVAAVMAEAQVVLCTTVGAGEVEVRKQSPYDVVVLDEAGQATEPSSWIPLQLGRKAVLAGDTCQLAPTILSQEAQQGGLGVSLMERAAVVVAKGSAAMLQVQYRMNSVISDWSSSELYEGKLVSSPSVASRLLHHLPTVKTTWSTEQAMVVLDTRLPHGSLLQGCEEMPDPLGSGSFVNEGEADIVVAHVAALLDAGVPAHTIAVQSPYLAQVQLLQSRLEDLVGAEEVEVASVDSFQGRQADAVVISLVRCNPMGVVGFVGDRRRMNVAVTRARRHVAIVCDSTTVAKNPFLRRLLQHVRIRGEVRSASSLYQDARAIRGSKSTTGVAIEKTSNGARRKEGGLYQKSLARRSESRQPSLPQPLQKQQHQQPQTDASILGNADREGLAVPH